MAQREQMEREVARRDAAQSTMTRRLSHCVAIFAPEVTTPVSVTVAKVGAALAALR